MCSSTIVRPVYAGSAAEMMLRTRDHAPSAPTTIFATCTLPSEKDSLYEEPTIEAINDV